MVITTAYRFGYQSRRTVVLISLPRIAYACILYPSHYFYVLDQCSIGQKRPPGAVTHERTRTSRWIPSWCTVASENAQERNIYCNSTCRARTIRHRRASQSESTVRFSAIRRVVLSPCLALACPAWPLARSGVLLYMSIDG